MLRQLIHQSSAPIHTFHLYYRLNGYSGTLDSFEELRFVWRTSWTVFICQGSASPPTRRSLSVDWTYCRGGGSKRLAWATWSRDVIQRVVTSLVPRTAADCRPAAACPERGRLRRSGHVRDGKGRRHLGTGRRVTTTGRKGTTPPPSPRVEPRRPGRPGGY